MHILEPLITGCCAVNSLPYDGVAEYVAVLVTVEVGDALLDAVQVGVAVDVLVIVTDLRKHTKQE